MQCCFHHVRLYGSPFTTGCQFDRNGEQLIECDGKLYCKYHLPARDKAGKETIKDQWSDEAKVEFTKSLISIAYIDEQCTDFSGIVFPSHFYCAGKSFRGSVWFDGCVFERGANFDRSHFGNLFFHFCLVKKGISFNSMHVNGNFSADRSIFLGSSSFKNAQFNDVFTCSGVRFEDKVYFGSLYQNQEGFRWATFQGTEFKGFATFENRFFRSQTNFSHCRFHRAPEFHGCTLHQDTSFEEAEFLDTSSEHSVRAYRTLKLAMENVRARKEEADFFALEQLSLRGQKKNAKNVQDNLLALRKTIGLRPGFSSSIFSARWIQLILLCCICWYSPLCRKRK